MKSLIELISSFEVKSEQDEFAVVDKADLKQAVQFLKRYQTLETKQALGEVSATIYRECGLPPSVFSNRISLNCDKDGALD